MPVHWYVAGCNRISGLTTPPHTSIDTPEAGVAHEVALDLKAGTSAPPLFGLRHFPVELAGLRSVFVARLRRGNFFVCTSGSFFWPLEPSRSEKWAQVCFLSFFWPLEPSRSEKWAQVCFLLLKNSPCRPKPRWGFALDPLVCPSLFRPLPTVRHPWLKPTNCQAAATVVRKTP
jgi:hypothetical protein